MLTILTLVGLMAVSLGRGAFVALLVGLLGGGWVFGLGLLGRGPGGVRVSLRYMVRQHLLITC